MEILVTGGAGFIGSHLVDLLVKQGHRVKVYDNLDPQVHGIKGKIPPYLCKDIKFIKGDVRDREKLFGAIKNSEVIFHYAAKVGIGQSMYEIKEYVDTNIGGTSNLLDILVNGKNKVKKVILAASMSSYGEGTYLCCKCGPVFPAYRSSDDLKKGLWEHYCKLCKSEIKPIPTAEGKTLLPDSIYAITKKVQEEIVMSISKAYKIPAVALRFFNVYGSRQSLSNPYTGVAAIFISRIKNNKQPVIYENGEQSRDLVSVCDIVQASILAMTKKESDYEVFNVGTGDPTSISKLASLLLKLMGKDIKPEVTNKFRKGDIRHCFADITKIKNKLGYEPQVKLSDGLNELANWSMGIKAVDKFNKSIQELSKKGLI